MKRLIIICFMFICTIFACGCKTANMVGMPNPWVDCEDNLNQAAKIAKFKFPLRLSNYWVRAMNGMIEISYPLDEFRDVTVRKATSDRFGEDISGVYTNYPVKNEIKTKNNISIKTRGNKDKIYVINIYAKKNIYSAYCKDGMSQREADGVCELLSELEK